MTGTDTFICLWIYKQLYTHIHHLQKSNNNSGRSDLAESDGNVEGGVKEHGSRWE